MKRKTISFRLSILFLSVVVTVLTIAMLSIQLLYNVSIRTIDKQAVLANTFVSDQMSTAFVQIDNRLRELATNSEAQAYLRNINVLSENDLSYLRQRNVWAEFSGKSYAFLENYYRTVGLIDGRGRIDSFGYRASDEATQSLLRLTTDKEFDKENIIWRAMDIDGSRSLVMLRKVRDLQYLDLSCIGYAFFIINFEALLTKTAYGYVDSVDSMDIYSAVYIGDSLLYSNIGPDIMDKVVTREQINDVYISNGERYLLSSHWDERYNMWYCTAQNVSVISKSIQLSRLLLMLSVSVGGAIIFAMALHGMRLVTRRITALTHSVGQVYENNFSLQDFALQDGYDDEVSVLSNSFRTLVEKVNSLVNEVLNRKLLHKETQVLFLQSQINPHFLYNTLDTISALATLNKPQLVSEVSSSMASIMRYSLDENILSHVGRDMDILRSYLVIQKLRYDERIVIYTYVCNSCEDIEIPKMTFQPLVENAIKYSVDSKPQQACVKLRVGMRNNNLSITVIDTGVGMPTDIVEHLLSKNFAGLPGHGLKNVFQRLDNLFGDRLKVMVRSRQGKGTALRIIITNQGDFVNAEKSYNLGR